MKSPANRIKFLDIKTQEAIVFKCTGKMLLKNFDKATFIITKQGLYFSENTEDKAIMLEGMFKREKFLCFKIPEIGDNVIQLGFNTKEFCNAVDGIAVTDSFDMYVLASNPKLLHIEIKNPNKHKHCERTITLIDPHISGVVSPTYEDFKPTATIASKQFKRAVVEVKKNSKQKVRIQAQESGTIMTGAESQLSGFKEKWGTLNGDTDEEIKSKFVYDEWIPTQRIHSVSEITQMTPTIRIYAVGGGRPLKIAADAKSLGTISYYLDGLPDIPIVVE